MRARQLDLAMRWPRRHVLEIISPRQRRPHLLGVIDYPHCSFCASFYDSGTGLDIKSPARANAGRDIVKSAHQY